MIPKVGNGTGAVCLTDCWLTFLIFKYIHAEYFVNSEKRIMKIG